MCIAAFDIVRCMTATAWCAPGAGSVGPLLREWRERRRLSQLELSIQADISTRHLSFVETGRSRPTSTMILRLTEQLQVPLRERNALLLAGGYAPAYPEHGFDGPQLDAVRSALRQVLARHDPYPAVVVNRWWELLDANRSITLFLTGVPDELVAPPVNVLRLTLHPQGLAPRILNLPQWRTHLLTQLQHRARAIDDHRLHQLHAELLAYPGGLDETPPESSVVLPMQYRHKDTVLSLFSIIASVSTANDVTVDELTVESFYPTDEPTADLLRSL